MSELFSFQQPFTVFIDGEKLEEVLAVQVTYNGPSPDQNKATVYYRKNGTTRTLTLELEAISFGRA